MCLFDFRKKLIFTGIMLICFIFSFVGVSAAYSNTYLLLWNNLKVGVRGEIEWESRSLIKVENPNSFPEYLSWKYDSRKADLTVEKLRLKKADGRIELLSLDVKDHGELVEKRASLEGLRSGDILDLSFTFRRESPLPPYFWWFLPRSENMEVKKLHIQVKSPIGFRSNRAFSGGVLDLDELSLADPFSPPQEPILITSLSSWDKASALFYSSLDRKFLPSEIRRKVSRVSGARAKLEVLWKVLSRKVKILKGWSFPDQFYRFPRLNVIWKSKKMTPSDFSFLLFSMLKALRLSPQMIWVSRWPLSDKYPVPSLLEYPLIRVVADDKTYWLDPCALHLPAGYISPRFQGKKGLLFSEGEAKFVDIPLQSEKLSSEKITFSMDLSKSGAYEFVLKIVSRGWISGKLKRFSKLGEEAGVKVKDASFGEKGGVFIGEVRGKGEITMENYGRKLVFRLPHLGFPVDFLSLPPRRSNPIDLGFLMSFEHNIVLKYPKGWKIVSLPLSFRRRGDAFSFSAKFIKGTKRKIYLTYSFKLRRKELSPEEWLSLFKGFMLLEDYVGTQLLFERR
ncbi:MAG: hypothetical protein J7M13_06920 [Synergistetes bacterium]|nr:hypothetical protein [Synergistota bacterium]